MRLSILFSFCAVLLFALPIFAQCGSERSSIKHATDSTMVHISTVAQKTTVAQLAKIKRPSKLQFNTRNILEYNTYEITCILKSIHLASDGDYHLVLVDKETKATLIAESINPNCALSSLFYSNYVKVRNTLNKLKPSKRIKQVNKEVIIKGVLFFDYIHGQLGVATNGVELHPILDIKILD